MAEGKWAVGSALVVLAAVGYSHYATLQRFERIESRITQVQQHSGDNAAATEALGELQRKLTSAAASHAYFELVLEGLARRSGLSVDRAHDAFAQEMGGLPAGWRWTAPWEITPAALPTPTPRGGGNPPVAAPAVVQPAVQVAPAAAAVVAPRVAPPVAVVRPAVVAPVVVAAPAARVVAPAVVAAAVPPTAPGITVQIDEQGHAHLDGRTLSDGALISAVRQKTNGNPDIHAAITLVPGGPHPRVLQIFNALRTAGVHRAAIQVP